jgi:hypothetical protein
MGAPAILLAKAVNAPYFLIHIKQTPFKNKEINYIKEYTLVLIFQPAYFFFSERSLCFNRGFTFP